MYWNLLPMGEKCTCIVRNPDKLLQPTDYESVKYWYYKTNIPFMQIFTPHLYGKHNIQMYNIAYRNQSDILHSIEKFPFRYANNSYQYFLSVV